MSDLSTQESDAQILWDDVTNMLEEEGMAPATLAMLRSCTAEDLTEDTLTISVKGAFVKRNVERNALIIEDALERAAFQHFNVRVTLAGGAPSGNPSAARSSAARQQAPAPQAPAPQVTPAPMPHIHQTQTTISREELERVMEDFSAGELDVLVATTIIESGIDNPHTNTLVIEDSQRLGLAQMYQLKGRVGRSSVQAYAYFMFPDNVNLTEEAEARLTALDEHTELGSGMRIAMRDLEIRGAGSLLGAEQSGNMSAVGFDLFAQMLEQAVAATREGDAGAADGLPPALSDITVNLPGHTYLPEEYVPDTDERVLWYRKIASAATMEDVEAIEQDMLAKRPEMPAAARNLFAKARVRAFANEHHMSTVTVAGGKLIVEPVAVPRDKMVPIRRAGGRYLAEKRKLTLPTRYFKVEEGDALFGAVLDFLKELSGGEGE